MPTETAAQRALTASTVALAVAVVCGVMFLPPLAAHTTASVLRMALTACTLAVALPLHWVFLGVAARRMGRSAAAWVTGAVLLCPLGGAASLILLGWLSNEPAGGVGAPSPHHG